MIRWLKRLFRRRERLTRAELEAGLFLAVIFSEGAGSGAPCFRKENGRTDESENGGQAVEAVV